MVIEQIEMGITHRETVPAVRMEREIFMEIVKQALGDYSPALAERLLPIAQTMTTFPISAWINLSRGCGCVVGEYLVAAEIIERDSHYTSNGIMELLADDPNGSELVDFGEDIDTRLYNYVTARVSSTSWYAILIED